MAANVGSLVVELTAETAKLRASMNEATSIIKGFAKQADFVGKSLSKVFNIAVPVGAIYGIQKLAGALGDLSKRGDEAGDIEQSFRRLGGASADIGKAKTAILGVVDSYTLMKIANQGMIRGLPDFEKHFDKIAELGAQFAQSTGIDTVQGIEKVTNAFESLKPKALAQVGIFVQAKEKADIYREAIEKLPGAMSRLPELQNDTAAAIERANASMKEASLRIARILSDSKPLGQFLSLVADKLSLIDANFREMFSDDLEAKIVRTDIAIEELQETLEDLSSWSNKSLSELLGFGNPKEGWDNAKVKSIQDQIAALQKARAELVAQAKKERSQEGGDKPNPWVPDEADLEAAARKLDSLKEKWASKVQQSTRDGIETGIDKAITNQDESTFAELKEQLRKTVYDGFVKEFEDAVKLGAVSLKDVTAQATVEAEKAVSEISQKWSDASTKAAEELAEKQKAAYQESVDFWQNIFRNALNGTTFNLKQAFDDLASGFAASLMAEIAGAPKGINSPQGLGQSLGKQVIGYFGGSGLQSGQAMGSGVSSSEAYGAGYQGPAMENGQFSSGYSNGQYAAAGMMVAIDAYEAGKNASKYDRENKDNRGTGAAVGSVAGGVIGAVFGGPIGAAIGAQIGNVTGNELGKMFKWGPQNPETKARHAFANFIEEGFSKLRSIAFFDVTSGKLKTLQTENLNFLEGSSSRFSNSNWSDQLNASKNGSTFSGLGEGFRALLGIEEDVGGQLGAYLIDNLGDSVDNARLLVQQLNVSFEDMETALVDIGRTGDKTWHETEVALQGVSQAFGEGLVQLGDVKGAYDEIYNSGGRGVAALKGIKDLAKEVQEAGGKTIGDIQGKLATAGVGQEEINAIMGALKDRGIDTLEELLGASDRIAGGIIADIYSKSESIRKAWDEQTLDFDKQNEKLDEMGQKLRDLPSEVNSKVHIQFESEFDANTKAVVDSRLAGDAGVTLPTVEAHASGAVLAGPMMMRGPDGQLHLAGEAGPEAILPLTTINGKLGVRSVSPAGQGMGRMQVFVDARGAAPGTEAKILQAMRSISEESASRAINSFVRNQRRGGRGAYFS